MPQGPFAHKIRLALTLFLTGMLRGILILVLLSQCGSSRSLTSESGDIHQVFFQSEEHSDLRFTPATLPTDGRYSLLPDHLKTSCQFRCGLPYLGPPYKCSCDRSCHIYGDCCDDFTEHCWELERTIEYEAVPLDFTCLYMNGVRIFVVTGCRKEARGIEQEEEPAHRAKLSPMTGRNSGYVFLNDTLAACYGDDKTEELIPWLRRECLDIETPTIIKDSERICFAYPRAYEVPKPRMCASMIPFPINPIDHAVAEVGSSKTDDLPDSFSVLLNFGPDGELHVLFSSHNDDGSEQCGENEIWDPFAEFCREIYCSANFQLDGLECSPTSTSNGSTPSTSIYGIDVTQVKLSLTIAVKAAVEPGNTVHSLEQQLSYALAPFADINADRFVNVTGSFLGLKQSTYIFEVDFVLKQAEKGSTEPSNDRVVSLMTHALSLNVFYFWIGPVQMEVTGIQERPALVEPEGIDRWCRGGTLLTYWNDEFQLKFVPLDDLEIMPSDNETFSWEMQVYIVELNETFTPSEFLTNILFHGNINRQTANVSGTVAVCRNRPYLADDVCPRMHFEYRAFERLLENNTLEYLGDLPYMPQILQYYEYAKIDEESIEMCFPQHAWFEDSNYTTVVTIMRYTNLILTTVSLVAMAASIVTFCVFPGLRNLPAKIRLHFTVALLVFQLSFLLGMRSSIMAMDVVCEVVSMVLHFEALTTFSWSSVIAWELFAAFGTEKALCKRIHARKERFLVYCGIGYGLPLAIVAIAIGMNYSGGIEGFNIRYGDYQCWLGDGLASGIFFGTPLAISIIFNAVMYARTMISIRRTGDSVRHKKHDEKQNLLDEVKLYARMSAALGFTWILGLLAVFVIPSNNFALAIVCLFLFIIFNASQGLMLFFAFTCTPRVLAEYRNFFSTGKRRISKKPSFTVEKRTSDSSNPRTEETSATPTNFDELD